MLLYDGILGSEVVRWCLEAADKGYRYAIEVNRPPRENWDEKLQDRKWYERVDRSMGYEGTRPRERIGKLYQTIHRDLEHPPRDEAGRYIGGMFIFLLDEQDYQSALAALDDVVNERPFKTILGDFNA